jgi:hypothetical protein
MIEGVDYCFIFPKDEKETVHVKFLEGEYKDTVFKYGKVKVEEKDDNAYLIFAYDVIESTVKKPRKLEKDEEFKNYIGNLLVEIISGNLDQDLIDENRTVDLGESDL